jgi:hypothetical protein
MVRSIVVLALCGAPLLSVHAQQPESLTVRSLGQPIGSMPLPRGSWAGPAREVAPGRLAFLDALNARVQVVDMASASVAEINWPDVGRRPFNVLSGLFHFGGDTLAAFGRAQGRYYPFTTGGAAPSVPLPAAPPRPASRMPSASDFLPPPAPSAADDRGNLYGLAMAMPDVAHGQFTPSDTQAVVRMDRALTRFDTLGWIHDSRMSATMERDSSGQTHMVMTPNLFAPIDAWAVLPDGRVAIVRGVDFHIDWTSLAGTHSSSPALPHVVRTFPDSEWARLARASVLVRTAPAPSDAGRLGLPPIPAPPMAPGLVTIGPLRRPAHIPFFSTVLGAPDSTLWIAVPADSGSATYLVVGETGSPVARMELPRGSRVVAFGTHSVYVIRTQRGKPGLLEQYAY